MALFTSQSAAAFYDKLFGALEFTLPRAATGRRGFPKEAMLCAFLVMKCEGSGYITDLMDYLENNRIIAEKYFGKTLGILKEGAAADIIIMDYKPFTPFSDENIDGHMIFGMEGKNCRTTIINGRVLYKDREFVGIDEDKINAWTMAESKKLWSTLNERTY